MSSKIILKKSSEAGKVPPSLEYGELALNYTDGILYYKNSSNQITQLVNSGSAPSGSSDRLINGAKTFLLQTDGSVKLPSAVASLSDGVQQLSGVQPQTVDTFPASQYRAVKYIVQAIAGPHSHSTEVLLTHNDTSVSVIEYGTVFSDFSLITVDANIESGNVVLKITPVFSQTSVSFYKTGMYSGNLPGGILLEGDLNLQTGTVDLMEGQETFDLQV